ncbi:MAG: hydrogenase expression/formation protein HypE [Candidatus Omnitrophica bacterium]|nr:hydrogenase expression/formation protein HypE [Candidatus Omnitrophota bacterium]
MQQLINSLILKNFGNPILNRLDDSAVLPLKTGNKRLAFTTDSFVVNPVFFPGGDIGTLAVCGTVNDLSMVGARPLFLSAGVIIEEGFPLEQLKRIILSMKKTMRAAGVRIVCGDTKVVNKGNCDKIFINTAGIGIIDEGENIGSANARPGDAVIISGTVGEHGIAILSRREGLRFKTQLKSDCAPLNRLVGGMLKSFPGAVHVMRDPTRGGTATALNEIAELSNVGIEVDEERIPVTNKVRGACELLGIDPLYLPCEGRLLAFVDSRKAEAIVRRMRKIAPGRDAAIIGRVIAGHRKMVYLHTLSGSDRILDIPIQDQMPRIC